MVQTAEQVTESYFAFGTHTAQDIDLIGQYSVRLKEMLTSSENNLYFFLEAVGLSHESTQKFYQTVGAGMSNLASFDFILSREEGAVRTLRDFYKKIIPVQRYNRNPFIEAQLSLVDQLNNRCSTGPGFQPRISIIIENADTRELEIETNKYREQICSQFGKGDLPGALGAFICYIQKEAAIIDTREAFVRNKMLNIKTYDPDAIFTGIYGTFHSLMFEGMEDLSIETEVLDHGDKPWGIHHFNLTDQLQRKILLSEYAGVAHPTQLDYMRGLIAHKLQERKAGNYKNMNRFNQLSYQLVIKSLATEDDFYGLYERILSTPRQGLLGEVTQVMYDFLSSKDRAAFDELIRLK